MNFFGYDIGNDRHLGYWMICAIGTSILTYGVLMAPETPDRISKAVAFYRRESLGKRLLILGGWMFAVFYFAFILRERSNAADDLIFIVTCIPWLAGLASPLILFAHVFDIWRRKRF